ncbi:putative pectinesterase/pectinesterase inhibitor 21 [Triticum urartu]|uniref:Pectinesterase n=1 Tax=Triticum urartu TaxID=4572 RepID=M7ZCM1_TRIUA|nr:putative pectinesterase/pectinesterase inhibitor 21 [Triticum urartu]
MSKGAIIGASTVLAVAVVAAVCVVSFKEAKNEEDSTELATSVKSIKSFCQPVDYKVACEKTLEETAGNATTTTELAKAIFKATSERIEKAVQESSLLNELKHDPRTSGALKNCKEMLHYAIDDLKTTFDQLGGFEMTNFKHAMDDLKTWLTSALTYQETCLDGFANTTTDASAKMRKALNVSQELTENILSIVDEFGDTIANLDLSIFSRRLLGHDGAPSGPDYKPYMTGAADGSGDYKTINEALAKVPLKSEDTYVMHVKEGTYKEYVSVARNVTNLVMIGDGVGKTVITGDKNFMMNITTKDTATMEAIGNGFFMRGITVENTAGAKNHQAVALRVQSDQSVFYECQFDGYQDTLYTHTSRQYYRDCTVSGTIDFIFGNAQVVFQNCVLQCKVHIGGLRTFLGRPWKEHSRTLYIQSEIGELIDPQGWLPWLRDLARSPRHYAQERFIQGKLWISKYGVPFIPGLLPQEQAAHTDTERS